MRVAAIIESKCWQHTDGRTASIFGASPWTRSCDESNWRVITRGWTFRMSNGTVGCGQTPFKTHEEALTVAAKINSLGG